MFPLKLLRPLKVFSLPVMQLALKPFSVLQLLPVLLRRSLWSGQHLIVFRETESFSSFKHLIMIHLVRTGINGRGGGQKECVCL